LQQIEQALHQELPKYQDKKGLSQSKLSEKKLYKFFVVEKKLTIDHLVNLNLTYTHLLRALPKIESGAMSFESVVEQNRNGNLNKSLTKGTSVNVSSLTVSKIEILRRKLDLPSRSMVVERAIEVLENQLDN
jgi:hypothetical protein